MSNMSTEDILNELAGYGTVNLKYNKFLISANPKSRIKDHWELELRLPGYTIKGAWIQRYILGQGDTISDVVNDAYQKLEDYYFSEQSKIDRETYEENHRFYQERYDNATEHQRHAHDPIRPPSRFVPPIVWGEVRTLDKEEENE